MDKFKEILELFKNHITLQNFSFMLGLFGSIGTAWNIIQNRKRLKLIVLKANMKDEHDFVMYIQLLNKSRLPIAISDISLKFGDIICSCEKEPCVALSIAHQRLGQTLIKDFYTQPFPLQLVGLGGMSAYLVFELPSDIHIDFSTPQTVQISTNRGKVWETKLNIPQINGRGQ